MATLPIFTRWLTRDDYGVMALSSVVAIAFTGLANLGINTGIERNFFLYKSDRQQLGKLIHSGLTFIFCATILWGVVLYALKNLMSSLVLGDETWGLIIWIICLTASLGVIFNVQLVYLRNQGRAREFAIYSVGSALVESATAVVLLVGMGLGLMGVVLGYFLGRLIVITVLWVRIAIELPLAVDRIMVRELLRIGLPLAPKVAAALVGNGVDRMLIRWLNSIGHLGLFGLANQIGQTVWKVMASVQNVYAPEVYRLMFESGDRGGARVGQYLTPYFYFSMLVPVLVILFVDEGLRVLVTPAFYDAKYIIVVLAGYYGQMFFGKITGMQLIYRKKMWYTTVFSVINLLLHVGLAFVFIPRYGALGAAFALFGSELVIEAISLWIAQREYPIVYELWFVLPMMALLYASMLWCLLPKLLIMPYSVTLVGKLFLLSLFLLGGLRWIQPARSHLAKMIRA